MTTHLATGRTTSVVAEWIASLTFERLPAQAIRFATDAVTDCVGVALAGSVEPLAPRLLGALDTWAVGSSSDRPGHHLVGSALRANATDAALYNGTVAHALDYDDINHPGYSHPSAHLLPALLAVAEETNASGGDVITAYAVGFELQGKLGRALNVGAGIPHLQGHYARGWHTTGTFGALAAAASVAWLLHLDKAAIAMALGIAGTSASGLRATFGTMSKPLNAGLAARNGVLAGKLAAAGFTAPDDILENRFGYFSVFSDAGWKVEPFAHLGDPLELVTPHGLALKPFPACGATHPAIEAALQVYDEVAGEPIESIRVGHNEVMSSVLVYDDPKVALEGKFSMQFCVAAALATGRVGISTFRDEVIADHAVRDLMSKLHVGVDERVRFNPEHGAIVSVRLESGREVERFVPLAMGKPERWMTTTDLFAKFADCCDGVIDDGAAKSVFDVLQSLPKLDTLAPVFTALDAATTR